MPARFRYRIRSHQIIYSLNVNILTHSCDPCVRTRCRKPGGAVSFWKGSEGKVKCSQPFAWQASQQNEPPNPNKNHGGWKTRHSMTYLRSFVTCPPCRRNYFCGACRRDGSILRSKDFANTQTLQPSASTKNRHWSRAGSPESRQASQMSFREYGKLSLHQARTCENIAHAHAK